MLQLIRSVLMGGIVAVGLQAMAADPPAKAAAPAAGKKLDLNFIPADAVSALVVQPRRFLQSPDAEWLPVEVISIAAKKGAGFDPVNLEQALAVVAPPGPADPEPRFGFIFRFSSPQDVAAVSAAIVPRGNDANWQGKKVRINTRPRDLSCAFSDARTLLIGTEPGLHWMLESKAADSPLRKLMAAADDAPVAAGFLAVAPLRPMLEPVLQQAAGHVPPPLAGFLKLPELIDAIETRVSQVPGSVGMLRLAVVASAPDPAQAEQLEQLVKQMLEMGRTMALTHIGGEMAQGQEDPEINQAMLRYLYRISDKVVAAAQPKRDANKLLFQTDVQGAASSGMLVALLLPAVQAAREAANRNVSANNLKQIGLGLLNHEDVKRRLPARASFDKDGKPLLSWRVHILPYLEEAALYQQFHLDEPWDSEHNKKLIEKMPDAFRHPKFDAPGMTLYLAVVGKGLGFEGNEGLQLRNFTDGTSKTILVVEAAPDKAVPWTKPEDWEPDGNDILNGLGGLFGGEIFNVLFCDCHVEAIASGIDRAVFKAMLTRNGGEAIPR